MTKRALWIDLIVAGPLAFGLAIVGVLLAPSLGGWWVHRLFGGGADGPQLVFENLMAPLHAFVGLGLAFALPIVGVVAFDVAHRMASKQAPTALRLVAAGAFVAAVIAGMLAVRLLLIRALLSGDMGGMRPMVSVDSLGLGLSAWRAGSVGIGLCTLAAVMLPRWPVAHRGMWRWSPWFVLIALVSGAILSPSPDVLSMLVLALPIIALYGLAILVAWMVSRRRRY